jgi:hypothetical protein
MSILVNKNTEVVTQTTTGEPGPFRRACRALT